MSAWVLVTGGAARLGREMGLTFAKAKWNLICHYRNSESEALELCAEAISYGVQAHALHAELESEESCKALFQQAVQLTNAGLTCIINNASLSMPDNAHDFDEAQALKQLSVNLVAPMRFGKWFYSSLLNSNGTNTPKGHHSPSMIHILDQKVFNLNPDYFSYTVSKLALERIVALQAQSFGAHLRVNAVSPGLLYPSGPQNLENFQTASRANLMGEAISPEQVAKSALFLAENPCITGTTLQVDNGQHLVPSARDIMFVTDKLLNEKK